MPSGVEISSVGMKLPDNISYESWLALMGRAAIADRGLKWVLADGLNFGERRFGSKYQAVIEATGLDYGSLRNICSVARQVELSRRRDKLSISHHIEVAPLHPLLQSEWLDKAESEGLSKGALRAAIKESKQPTKGDAPVIAVKPVAHLSNSKDDPAKPEPATKPTAFTDGSPVVVDLGTGEMLPEIEADPFEDVETEEAETETLDMERIPEGQDSPVVPIGARQSGKQIGNLLVVGKA